MQSKMSSKVDHLPAYFRNSSSSSCSIILGVVVLPMNEEFLLLSEFGGKDADENFTFPHTPLCSLIKLFSILPSSENRIFKIAIKKVVSGSTF